MTSIGGERVKSSWVTRRVPVDLAVTWQPPAAPVAGDLLLCEVEKIGLHGRIETVTGAREKLYAGDRIVCAVANRYATSLLEAAATVRGDHADMISASGLCGTVTARSNKASTPTALRIVAQAFAAGRPLNVRAHGLGPAAPAVTEPAWVVVVGSAMDSGKTTACASIVHGLAAAGRRVAALKLTGTASGRDVGAFRDAGAWPVYDFLDAGWASTAGCAPADLTEIVSTLAGHVRAAGATHAVVEIADGLLQPETQVLLGSLTGLLDPALVVVTARESLAAAAAVERLALLGFRVAVVSGLLTNSPLACREAEAACAVPCIATAELGRRVAQQLRGPASVPASVVAEPLGAPTP